LSTIALRYDRSRCGSPISLDLSQFYQRRALDPRVELVRRRDARQHLASPARVGDRRAGISMSPSAALFTCGVS
jgi:hypothetical protein